MKKTISILLLITMILTSAAPAFADNTPWVCPRCGTQAVGNFCTNCGTRRPAWRCPECGRMVEGEYCSYCTEGKSAISSSTSKAVSDADIGDYITFGTYELDNDMTNRGEPIEWLVLDKKDGKLLVISKYALDTEPYHNEDKDVTWENCYLRSWLNQKFRLEVFSDDELRQIEETLIVAEDNEGFGIDAGNDTWDALFLLSSSEAENLFETDEARICYPSEYAKAKGAYIKDDGSCVWWLRSPGNFGDCAAFVNYDGRVMPSGVILNVNGDSVRPAMWINPGN